MKTLLNLFVGMLLCFSFSQDKVNVAVIDLEGKGIPQEEASVITDKFRGELIKTGKFTVVERGQMNAILKEQGFQQAGCTSNECAVEIGQLIGVEKMVAGSIGKVGSLYLISIRLIDVSSGQIIKDVSEEIHGVIEDVLRIGITNSARRLGGLESERDAVGQPPPPPLPTLTAEKPEPAIHSRPHKKFGAYSYFQPYVLGFRKTNRIRTVIEQEISFEFENDGGGGFGGLEYGLGLSLRASKHLILNSEYSFFSATHIKAASDLRIYPQGFPEVKIGYTNLEAHVAKLVLNLTRKFSKGTRGSIGLGLCFANFKNSFIFPRIDLIYYNDYNKTVWGELNVNGSRTQGNIFRLRQGGTEGETISSNSLGFFIRSGIEFPFSSRITFGIFNDIYVKDFMPKTTLKCGVNYMGAPYGRIADVVAFEASPIFIDLQGRLTFYF